MLVDIKIKELLAVEKAILSFIQPNIQCDRIGRGLYQVGHWNFEMYYSDNENWQEYSSIVIDGYEYHSYGVCDSPAQFMEKCGAALEYSPNKYVVAFVGIAKADQPSDGGWRWHKWGEYIGNQIPVTEYIYDEPLINEVYTYHFYLIDEKKEEKL